MLLKNKLINMEKKNSQSGFREGSNYFGKKAAISSCVVNIQHILYIQYFLELLIIHLVFKKTRWKKKTWTHKLYFNCYQCMQDSETKKKTHTYTHFTTNQHLKSNQQVYLHILWLKACHYVVVCARGLHCHVSTLPGHLPLTKANSAKGVISMGSPPTPIIKVTDLQTENEST